MLRRYVISLPFLATDVLCWTSWAGNYSTSLFDTTQNIKRKRWVGAGRNEDERGTRKPRMPVSGHVGCGPGEDTEAAAVGDDDVT